MELLVQNPLLALFVIIALGLLIGAIHFKNVSLGASGIIFSSLGLGMLGCSIPEGVDKLGLVLFVYAVGIGAGPGFFRVFVHEGVGLAKLGLVITAAGAGTAVALAYAWDIPVSLTAGIFAGALTSTPALAAALDVVKDAGAVSVGYGVAYPFGVIGVVLFVQFLPKILRLDLKSESEKYAPKEDVILRVLIEVLNPTVIGRKISDIGFLKHHSCCLSRVLVGDQLVPLETDMALEKGMVVLAIGEQEELDDLTDLFGKRSDRRFFIDADTRKKVIVTSPKVVGKSVSELRLLADFGLVASRIKRNGVEFVPSLTTRLQLTDMLTVVGSREGIQRFSDFAGHRERVLNETDLVAVSIGIGGGLLLGMIPIAIPGAGDFSLGLAGGPLLTGLVMAHFGQIGRIRGYIPPAARRMMMNLGLAFFLAGAGIKAGARLPEILMQHGPLLLLMAVIVTVVPMVFGYFVARKVLKLNVLQVLGGICGGMTSTPGLGAVNDSVDSPVPAMSYAAAYPISLILMTVFTQLIVRTIS